MPPVHRLLHRVLDTTQAPQADDGKAQGVLRNPARSRGRLTGKTVSILYEANEVCNRPPPGSGSRRGVLRPFSHAGGLCVNLEEEPWD